MPVVAELQITNTAMIEWIGVCARLGFEMGADVVKTCTVVQMRRLYTTVLFQL